MLWSVASRSLMDRRLGHRFRVAKRLLHTVPQDPFAAFRVENSHLYNTEGSRIQFTDITREIVDVL
jgi:hypothetical protein